MTPENSPLRPRSGRSPARPARLLELCVREGELLRDVDVVALRFHDDRRVVVFVEDRVEHADPLLHQDLAVLVPARQQNRVAGQRIGSQVRHQRSDAILHQAAHAVMGIVAATDEFSSLAVTAFYCGLKKNNQK